MKAELVIVGAGLAGLVAAIRLYQLGYSPIIIDYGLAESTSSVGGFAKYTGAKFSLPPAGMGLLNVIETKEKLWEAIDSVAEVLNIDFSSCINSIDSDGSRPNIREYSSLVLKPDEIDRLLVDISKYIKDKGIKIINAKCNKINIIEDKIRVEVVSDSMKQIFQAEYIFYAAGRLGASVLEKAGVPPTAGKGLDVGVRVEFMDKSGLTGIRALGPDAKIIKERCRTFCLNVPGEIYRYPYKDISIPGGIVADDDSTKANVGLLYRANNKSDLIEKVLTACSSFSREYIEKPFLAVDSPFGPAKKIMNDLFGIEVVQELECFCDYLGENGLIRWDLPHNVHIPLIDWHWSTFSTTGSFKTEEPRVICIGDLSGHARGLLQAAVSGWVAAEEFANAD